MKSLSIKSLLQNSFVLVLMSALSTTMTATSVQASEALVEAIRKPYENHRFEKVEVTVHQCEITLIVEDKDACTADHNFVRTKRYVHLGHNRPITERATIARAGDLWLVWLKFEPVGNWATETDRIESRLDRLLTKARSELGRGPNAAAQASSQLSQEFSLDRFFQKTVSDTCGGDQLINPVYDRLRLSTTSVDDLLNSLTEMHQACHRN